MKILLINANPVVSRLLVLCTRDENTILDEAENAGMVKSDDYDIVLVDEASYGADVTELLTLLGRCKKVFISYNNEPMHGFDLTIKKPFLPSQILELLENSEPKVEVQKEEEVEEEIETVVENHFIFPLSTEESSKEEEKEEEMPTIFPLSDVNDMIEEISEDEVPAAVEENENSAVLDTSEIEKIKALLDMDEEELALPTEELSDDEYELRKIEVITEQLIADGLEIVAEEEIVEALSNKRKKKKEKKNKSKKKKKNKKIDKKKSDSQKNKKKEVTFTEEELESIEDAIEVAVGTVTKKQMKQLLKGEKIEVSIEIEGDK